MRCVACLRWRVGQRYVGCLIVGCVPGTHERVHQCTQDIHRSLSNDILSLYQGLLGKTSRINAAVLLDFVHMRGGGMPKFFVTFSLVHFWSIKRVYFLQNANNFNFKLFLRLYTWPTKQVFCLFYEESWIMSHFEFRLNRRLGVQKSCTR